ncbi:MAG: methyltransferase [Planctomycetota bacterium]
MNPTAQRRPVPAALLAALPTAFLAAGLTGGCQSPAPAPEVPAAQEQRTAVPEGINEKFLDPTAKAEDYVARWEIESREVYASRDHIVAALGLKPGDRVADIGTGTGLFLEPLANAVGEGGKVYATDISVAFLEHVRGRVAENGWTQVQPILGGTRTTALLDDSIDLAFTCDVYHHFEYHQDMLRSIRAALRPGGTLVIVDFERIPGVTREWLLNHVRASKETVIEEVTAAGFELEREVPIEGFEENYLLRFSALPE